MTKANDNYKIDFTKLESKVETMSEKLNKLDEIEITLKEIQKALNNNHTDVVILKKDLDNIGEKQRNLEVRVRELEKKVQGLVVKVTSIVSIASFLGWIVSNLLMK